MTWWKLREDHFLGVFKDVLWHEMMVCLNMDHNEVHVSSEEVTSDLHSQVHVFSLLKQDDLVVEDLELSILMIGRLDLSLEHVLIHRGDVL